MSPLRPISAADHTAVLAWNEAHVDLLAPLDEPRLRRLTGWARTAAIITDDGRDVGFVITIGPGSTYDSENYRWFAARHEGFFYLDRIVIDPSARRSGLGTRVYDALEAEADGLVFCLEVNVDPPNEPSLAFHRARGFVEVGRQEANGHLVGLMEKYLSR